MADNEKEFDWIQETVEDFRPFHNRQDVDADMYNQIAYQLKDLDTNTVSKNVVNITMNDARVFADRAQAFMNEASMQVEVTGNDLSEKDAALIENFDSDLRYEIDERLNMRDISGLYPFAIEQGCIRGLIGGRYVTWDRDEQYVPDMLLFDSRFLLYEYGEKDLERAAGGTVRSKASILLKYPKADLGAAKRGGIWEEWTKKKCKIWLCNPDAMHEGGQLLTEYENIFGYVPFIIQGVGAGSMLQDKNSRVHKFESIFANNRLLYEHVNMLGSILQTLNYMSFNRVHLWESEQGALAKKPPKPGTRKTIAIDKGTRGLFPMEVADVTNATRLFQALLLGAVQRGSLPNIDYGNLTFPLSAVAISKLTQTKDAIFSPRLQAISLFLRKWHKMARDQYVAGSYEAELGEEGLKRTYTASDIDKKYKISYKFHSVSPEQNIANYAIAQQALAVGVAPITVYSEILKFQDPAGEIMKGRAHKAEQIDPVIALFRYGHSLIDEKSEEGFLEADLVAMKIEKLLRQPELPPEPQKQAKQGKSLVPLLEGGGGGSIGGENDEMEPEERLRHEDRRAEVVRKSEAE